MLSRNVNFSFLHAILDPVSPEECHGNVAQQHTERFASTLSIDSNITGSNSSGCKDYQSEYKKRFPISRQQEVEVLPAVRKPGVRTLESSSILDNGNKLDAYHPRLFCSPEVTNTESIADSKLLLYNAQDCENTPEHVVLPSRRQDAIPADSVPHNNNLRVLPVVQSPHLNSKGNTQQQLPAVNVGNNNYNSPVTVAEDTDQFDDDQDGDVMVPQDASSDNGAMMVIPKGDSNFLHPVGGK